MNPLRISLHFVLGLILLAVSVVQAQEIVPTVGIDWKIAGRVAPRSAAMIKSSPWSVGGETLDRGYATYANYRSYLGPLGAKGLRLQAGWANCEKRPGVYDFAWIDVVVDDALAQGVQPWLELSYGNPIYPGGGDAELGGGFPSSIEALAAWDRWALALVEHFKGRVHQWEIWNEGDLNKRGTAPAPAYVDLYIRTAEMIRRVQPGSQIWALALARSEEYAEAFVAGMAARGKTGLIDAITFHGYPRNPDDTAMVDRLRAITAKHGREIPLRQGETGAPSQYQENFALAKLSWSETTQAKWDLRRLLAHHAKDVPMNLFTMSDMHYASIGKADAPVRMNHKGLLATNPDQEIVRVKAVYPAAQALFSIFDDRLKRLPNYPFTSTALRGLGLAGYQHEDGGQVVALWFNDAPPTDANGVTPAVITLAAGRFREPVLVDLRTCLVYEVPPGTWQQDAGGVTFRNLPMYDSPLLIAEKAVVSLMPSKR